MRNYNVLMMGTREFASHVRDNELGYYDYEDAANKRLNANGTSYGGSPFVHPDALRWAHAYLRGAIVLSPPHDINTDALRQ